MECPFWGEEGVWLKGTERDMGEGVKNVHFLGDVLNGCSPMSYRLADVAGRETC